MAEHSQTISRVLHIGDLAHLRIQNRHRNPENRKKRGRGRASRVKAAPLRGSPTRKGGPFHLIRHVRHGRPDRSELRHRKHREPVRAEEKGSLRTAFSIGCPSKRPAVSGNQASDKSQSSTTSPSVTGVTAPR